MDFVKMNKNKKIPRKIRHCRVLPAELLVEMYKWLPIHFGIEILIAMPSVLIARYNGPILKRQFKQWKMAIMENTWKMKNANSDVNIGENGLMVAKWFNNNGIESVRAKMPIRLFKYPFFKMATNIAGYFEVEILRIRRDYSYCSIFIGFCGQGFPLKYTFLGGPKRGTQITRKQDLKVYDSSSIGIVNKKGMKIDGQFSKFNEAEGGFRIGDVIGMGLIECAPISSIKCFATWNGQLLGSMELASKFAGLKLFPAVTLRCSHDLIEANFGKNPFRFDFAKLADI